jgi:hypothetical protein
MPEIHIPTEAADPQVDEAARIATGLRELADRTSWELWLSEQSATTQALAAEWQALRGSRFALRRKADKQGRIVHVCESTHGYHESRQSAEHALFLLVDSHRVREEDRTSRVPRRDAQRIAKAIREANPAASGEERDALFLAKLDELERGR